MRKTRKIKDGTETLIDISHIGAKGDGIGRYEGKPVYAAKTAPGDLARARLETVSEEGYRARLLSIERPGPERANPPCPLFARCGGCALQHVTQQFYRDWKTEKVASALERAGVKCERWETPVFLPAATRRRASLSAYKAHRELRLGYNEARSRLILDIPHCMVLEPELDAKIAALRPFLPRLLPDNTPVDIMLHRIDGAYDMILSGDYRTRGRFSLAQEEAMAEIVEKLEISRISWRAKDFAPAETILARAPVVKKFGALAVNIPPGAFLQASQAGEDALVSIVTGAAGEAARIADLFCGCGTFAGNLSQNEGRNVTAIDGEAAAVTALTKAAPKGLIVRRRDLFENPLTPQELAPFDCVALDPPRAGAKEQSAALAYSKVPVVIYVSCNPATFARDAKILREGGYTLKSLTLIDQFVWSAHIEVAGVFMR